MTRQRVLTVPLGLALMAVGGILAGAAVLRWWPPSAASAVQQLDDGDLEADERRRLLRSLLDDGDAAPPPEWERQLRGAMAALALDDAEAWQRRMGAEWRPGGSAAASATAIRAMQNWTFGDAPLERLLAAMQAELAGDRDAARSGYAQAAASARLFHLRLCGELARQGSARLP